KLPDIGWSAANYDSILELWIINWDTTTVDDGIYYLEYTVEDVSGAVLTGVLMFTVQNNPSETSSYPKTLLATTPGYTILFLVPFLCIITIFWKKRSR
ncbi:MAG: hypothetical protein ACTSPG_05705, partial [Candidatus Hodarchaeales archaeon]